MSSIYRKGGASGYYYYQTYIYNPESGKKDKRIFHSLGTRDISEASLGSVRTITQIPATMAFLDIPKIEIGRAHV